MKSWNRLATLTFSLLTIAGCQIDGAAKPDADRAGETVKAEAKNGASTEGAEFPGAQVAYAVVAIRRASGQRPGVPQKVHVERGMAVALQSDDGSCLLLTAQHVIDRATQVMVRPWTATGPSVDAVVEWADVEQDLAALRIKRSDSYRSSGRDVGDDPGVGRQVYAFTNENQGRVLVTSGIVSGKWSYPSGEMLALDMQVHAGHSGSPVIDRAGKVVGMVQLKRDGDGITFALAVPRSRLTSEISAHSKPDRKGSKEIEGAVR